MTCCYVEVVGVEDADEQCYGAFIVLYTVDSAE